MADLSVLLLATAACSNNASKQAAEHSSVSSGGAGKGTAPPAKEAKQADQALVRFVNGTGAAKDLAFGDAMAFTGTGADDVIAYKELAAEWHDFKLFAHAIK